MIFRRVTAAVLRQALKVYRPRAIPRREFLKRCAAAGGAAAWLMRSSGAATAQVVSATDRIVLGRSGIEVSRLALGSGSGGWGGASNQTRRLGVEGYAALLRHGFDRGITFWDSADMYGSHPHLAAALRELPREKIVILTKTTSRDAKGVRADLDRFLRELNTDYIDILLLHCLTDTQWPSKMREVMEVLSEARASGRIRAHGVSCHSFGALQAAAAEPWVDIDLARINPAGVHMDAPPAQVVPVLKKMHSDGKGVIGMKIYGAGSLVRNRPACLRYVFGLGCVPSITLGIESVEELEVALEEIARV